MRLDSKKFNFTDKYGTQQLAEFDVSDVDQFSIALFASTVTGSPTSYYALAYAMSDTGGIVGEACRTGDIVPEATAKLFSQYESTVIGTVHKSAFRKIRVVAGFNGGTSPKMTGSVYVYLKRL